MSGKHCARLRKLALLALLTLACEESPQPSPSQPEPQRFAFTATLGNGSSSGECVGARCNVPLQGGTESRSQPIELVPDEVGSETPDTISLDFGLSGQTYVFNPSGRGTLRVDVRVRNNFGENASAIIVVLKSIQPATVLAPLEMSCPRPATVAHPERVRRAKRSAARIIYS